MEPEPGREGAHRAYAPFYWSPKVLKDTGPAPPYPSAVEGHCQNVTGHTRSVPGSVADARSRFTSAKFILAGPGFVWHGQVAAQILAVMHTLLCGQRPVPTGVAADGISLYCGSQPAFCQLVLSSTYPSVTALPAAWPFGQNQSAL